MTYSTHLLRHLRFIIGQNIHALRAKRKMPILKLSRLSGVPERLLDHYELGKNEIGLDELLKIACVLKIEPQELLDWQTREVRLARAEIKAEKGLSKKAFIADMKTWD